MVENEASKTCRGLHRIQVQQLRSAVLNPADGSLSSSSVSSQCVVGGFEANCGSCSSPELYMNIQIDECNTETDVEP